MTKRLRCRWRVTFESLTEGKRKISLALQPSNEFTPRRGDCFDGFPQHSVRNFLGGNFGHASREQPQNLLTQGVKGAPGKPHMSLGGQFGEESAEEPKLRPPFPTAPKPFKNCDPDCLVQPPNSRIAPKSIGDGASSLFGGWPGSPEKVSCSRATPDLHRWETFSGLPGHPPKRLLAPSPIDLGAIREFGGCTRQSGPQFLFSPNMRQDTRPNPPPPKSDSHFVTGHVTRQHKTHFV